MAPSSPVQPGRVYQIRRAGERAGIIAAITAVTPAGYHYFTPGSMGIQWARLSDLDFTTITPIEEPEEVKRG